MYAIKLTNDLTITDIATSQDQVHLETHTSTGERLEFQATYSRETQTVEIDCHAFSNGRITTGLESKSPKVATGVLWILFYLFHEPNIKWFTIINGAIQVACIKKNTRLLCSEFSVEGAIMKGLELHPAGNAPKDVHFHLTPPSKSTIAALPYKESVPQAHELIAPVSHELVVSENHLTVAELESIITPGAFARLRKVKFGNCVVAVCTDGSPGKQTQVAGFTYYTPDKADVDDASVMAFRLLKTALVKTSVMMGFDRTSKDRVILLAILLLQFYDTIGVAENLAEDSAINRAVIDDQRARLSTMMDSIKEDIKIRANATLIFNMVFVYYDESYPENTRLAVGGFKDDGTPVFREIFNHYEV